MDEKFPTFELDIFVSNVCHRVHDMGELDFIVDTLQSEIIFRYWEENEQFQALYLLDMVLIVCDSFLSLL